MPDSSEVGYVGYFKQVVNKVRAIDQHSQKVPRRACPANNDSFRKHSLSTYHVPDCVLDTGATRLWSQGLLSVAWRWEKVNRQEIRGLPGRFMEDFSEGPGACPFRVVLFERAQ